MEKVINFLANRVRHYDPKSYWKMREKVVDPDSKLPKIVKYIYYYRIKKMDAFNNASMGTGIGYGAKFSSVPILHHGLNGIIISHYATIGRNAMIFQQVTIAERGNKAATIGDNCMIGAGAKIIGGVTIGDNVIIGANAVVTKDVPSDCTVAGVPAKIISQRGRSCDV